ncbi:hypothetical protein O0A58_12065, partial [Staphylococcus pseudintermedius]|nr:hypothetical protein [Staphylococcus pseudintermedius]MDK3763532.1 hypothetical protein [Staphylococcus pseudintermedius]
EKGSYNHQNSEISNKELIINTKEHVTGGFRIDIIVERLMKDDKIQTIPRTEKDNNSLLQALCREFEIGHAYSEKGGDKVVTLKKTIQYNL